MLSNGRDSLSFFTLVALKVLLPFILSYVGQNTVDVLGDTRIQMLVVGSWQLGVAGSSHHPVFDNKP